MDPEKVTAALLALDRDRMEKAFCMSTAKKLLSWWPDDLANYIAQNPRRVNEHSMRELFTEILNDSDCNTIEDVLKGTPENEYSTYLDTFIKQIEEDLEIF